MEGFVDIGEVSSELIQLLVAELKKVRKQLQDALAVSGQDGRRILEHDLRGARTELAACKVENGQLRSQVEVLEKKLRKSEERRQKAEESTRNNAPTLLGLLPNATRELAELKAGVKAKFQAGLRDQERLLREKEEVQGSLELVQAERDTLHQLLQMRSGPDALTILRHEHADLKEQLVEALSQIEECRGREERQEFLLSEARMRYDCLRVKNPWLMLRGLPKTPPIRQIADIKPFLEKGDAREFIESLPPTAKARFKPKSILFLEESEVTWFPQQPEHGLLAQPRFSYKSTVNADSVMHQWIPNLTPVMWEHEARDVVCCRQGSFFYMGRYRGLSLPNCSRSASFQHLSEVAQKAVSESAIIKRSLTTPIVVGLIESMYAEGVLDVHCTLLQRTGFNEDLYGTLLSHQPQPTTSQFTASHKRKHSDFSRAGKRLKT